MRKVVLALIVLLLGAGLGGCGVPAEPSWPLTEPLPPRLSELGVLEVRGDHLGGQLDPGAGLAYRLGHPLFSDYASKYRTVHLPAGKQAGWSGDDDSVLDFPRGSVITKTFFYPLAADGRLRLDAADEPWGQGAALDLRQRQLLETRVLRHGPEGWEAVSYLWDEQGEEAWRRDTGALLSLTTAENITFDYLVPDRNQCAACHGGSREQREPKPIGPKPANLAVVEAEDGSHQLQYWVAKGWLPAAGAAAPEAIADTVTPWPRTADARAYLDVNCAHCHRGEGSAASAGLDLRFAESRPFALGVCKPPVAAGRGSGGHRFGIWPGRPEASILWYRLAATDPAVMMPELGRALVDEQGVALIAAWIEQFEGDCVHAGLL